jgi:hypothetical protein
MKTKIFITKAEKIHNGKYTYEKTNYINAITKIIITCSQHGDFEQTPHTHLHGSGCQKCVGRNKTTQDFIKEAEKIHNGKYTYQKTIYVDSRLKLIITCPIHGDFEQIAANHLQGRGCPMCNGTFLKTRELFIEEANNAHNGKYDYSLVNYINNKTKVKIICPIHGEFEQTPKNHLTGRGCPACGDMSMVLLKTKTTPQFIEKALKVHNNFYSYEKTIYVDSRLKLIITCPIHGDFEQTASDHLSGYKCYKCGVESQTKTLQDFINQSNIVHNGKYDYRDSVYINGTTKLAIICPTHGSFEQLPSMHLSGNGCPKCCSNISRPEIAWLDSLNISTKHRNTRIILKNGSYIKPDGYVPDTNTIYEFWGDYWHGNPARFPPEKMNLRTKKTYGQLYIETMNKREMILNSGFNLVEIWESDWNILQKELNETKTL